MSWLARSLELGHSASSLTPREGSAGERGHRGQLVGGWWWRQLLSEQGGGLSLQEPVGTHLAEWGQGS